MTAKDENEKKKKTCILRKRHDACASAALKTLLFRRILKNLKFNLANFIFKMNNIFGLFRM